jgi:hypothetical protein
MNLLDIATSLLGGAVGGVLTAGKIARSGEKARARFEAEEAIRASVTVYRATMVYDHEQLYEPSHYSKEYTSVEGQEIFASDVLTRLPSLSKKTGERVQAELQILLGDLTYKLAVQRAFVPLDRIDPDKEGERRALVLFQILNTEEDRLEGLLRRMLASQNRGESHNELYAEALMALDRILLAVSGRRPRQKRGGKQQHNAMGQLPANSLR